MTNPRGPKFERDLRDWFRDKGLTAERLRTTGRNDEGDLFVDDCYVVEAKAPGKGKPINLSGWVREARLEAVNYAAARNLDALSVIPLVVIKAAGKSISESYVVMQMDDFFGTTEEA